MIMLHFTCKKFRWLPTPEIHVTKGMWMVIIRWLKGELAVGNIAVANEFTVRLNESLKHSPEWRTRDA